MKILSKLIWPDSSFQAEKGIDIQTEAAIFSVNRFLKNQQGFTLIETMIALVLLVVGIMSIYTMQISSLNGNAKANRIVTATAAAADSYERLLNVPYDDPTMDTTLNHDNTEFPPDFSLPPGVTGVNWSIVEWTNSDGLDNDDDGETDEGDEIDIKVVTLSINYNDRNVPRTVTVNFYKSKAF